MTKQRTDKTASKAPIATAELSDTDLDKAAGGDGKGAATKQQPSERPTEQVSLNYTKIVWD